MRRLLTGLLLLMVFSALPAQQLTQEKNLSMWELKGPVKTLLETSYRSDRFDTRSKHNMKHT